MTAPFEPIGAEPRWRIAYRLLTETEVGGIVTYDALAEAMGLDPASERALAQLAVRRALREYEKQDLHTAEAVRNVGYRVVDTNGHLMLARRHSRKAGTQHKLGKSKVENVDLSGAEPEVRKAFEVIAHAFAQQQQINRRILEKQARQDRALSLVAQRTERTDEELAQMRKRIEDVENRLSSRAS